MAAMKKAGKTEFYTLTEADRKTWTDSVKPVYTEVGNRVGKDVLDIIAKAAGAATN